MKHSVKLLTLLFFFCMNFFVLKAQQKHFIYVQSEDRQPFAVVLGGKVFSSSDYGYVIIPKLADSTYNFTVSFPMNKFPDQAFACSINKKDAGYILKSETDGWALQNMQTQKFIMNSNAAVAQKNAFGNMLSDVVNDSTLTKTNAVEKPADATVTNEAISVIPATAAITENNTGIVTDSLQQPQKISEQKLDTGTSMLFVDKTQNGIDTINVFVPAETAGNNVTADQQSLPGTTATLPVITAAASNSASNDSSSLTSENVAANNNETQDTTTHTESNPFYKPEQSTNAAVTGSDAGAVTEIAITSVSGAVKQDCGNMLSDDDLNKLKRKMFAQSNDYNMIQYAVKYMNKKCMTTDQVKLLGGLFTSDDGRYTLYDALYNYVYDYGNYPVLAGQILDPYYKKRFAAMLR